jgi:uncharacterized protein YndB with AHSA1/START domain
MMDRGKVTLQETPLGATIQRWFPASPELVYRSWIEVEHIQHWFATDGYEVTRCEIDARAGGKWRVDFRSATGNVYYEQGEFREMVPGKSLALTLTQCDGAHTGPQTLVTVTFEPTRGGTEMTFRQTGYDSSMRRDGNAEGWQECFDKLLAALQTNKRHPA